MSWNQLGLHPVKLNLHTQRRACSGRKLSHNHIDGECGQQCARLGHEHCNRLRWWCILYSTANDPTTITPYAALVHVAGPAHPVVAESGHSTTLPSERIVRLVILIGCRVAWAVPQHVVNRTWVDLHSNQWLGRTKQLFRFISTFGAITPNTTPVTFTVTLTGGSGNCSSNGNSLGGRILGKCLVKDHGHSTLTAKVSITESLDNAQELLLLQTTMTPFGTVVSRSGVSGGYTKGQDDAGEIGPNIRPFRGECC